MEIDSYLISFAISEYLTGFSMTIDLNCKMFADEVFQEMIELSSRDGTSDNLCNFHSRD